MMHSERYPKGGIVVEKTIRRESIIQTFDLLRFEPKDIFKISSRKFALSLDLDAYKP